MCASMHDNDKLKHIWNGSHLWSDLVFSDQTHSHRKTMCFLARALECRQNIFAIIFLPRSIAGDNGGVCKGGDVLTLFDWFSRSHQKFILEGTLRLRWIACLCSVDLHFPVFSWDLSLHSGNKSVEKIQSRGSSPGYCGTSHLALCRCPCAFADARSASTAHSAVDSWDSPPWRTDPSPVLRELLSKGYSIKPAMFPTHWTRPAAAAARECLCLCRMRMTP